MQNNGVFKDVEHYPMHIIPCFLNDEFTWVESKIEVSEEEFNALSVGLADKKA